MIDVDAPLPDPWAEQAPEVPRRTDEPVDLTAHTLSYEVGQLGNDVEEASRVLAQRISNAGRASARYELRRDSRIVQIRSDGKRTAADERLALVHEDPELAQLALEARLAAALVESARAWVRGLEHKLSAKQSQLKASLAVEGVPDPRRDAAHTTTTLRAA